MKEFYDSKIKKFEIITNRKIDPTNNTLKAIPEIKVKFLSEYNWQLMALHSRMKYPELYEHTEEPQQVISELRKWIKENSLV